MRTAFAAALLAAAACTSDPAVDPAWVTAGSAPPCTEDNAVLADPIGSWHAEWACLSAADLATGTEGLPCDVDVNPFLGADVQVVAGAAADAFTITIDGVAIAAERITDGAVVSEDRPAGGGMTNTTAIFACTEAANPVMLGSHWRPAATSGTQILNVWNAVLTRQ